MSKKNYTKFSNPQFAVDGPVNDIVDVAVVAVEPDKPKIGVVTDCVKLNVRKMANKNSNIICVIDASTDIEIDEKNSTNDFYKIRLSDGCEGFCMKRYVTIKP